ncbi:DNA repair protein RecN [Clostridium septicum]|uniref:DNA repair protein RecN n=2 Tax=Clostridium septicum TaxID=1504 RepID=A0A9N7JMQ5_CLOSE|nr:DNA repair protein RecN [Clostridium septicum]AYE35653.1 DNA repair protein RecN [Clostridium septicum]MDU1313251.1 DNA repair protein RecN [Clostridium septicum]UEC19682.1 DNA repair protein RecN [Clostridium septicum]USS02257.1 DNA repair protein RecN [Clostridium septicum]WLF70837.1 DNA repair protein RecN [Clostridium septicum]
MLLQLNIKNFALIQDISVEFGEGFNILSGETGAGKSILIDTIDYVLGGKFSKDLIRYGESKTFVEAVFSIENEDLFEILKELEIEIDEVLIISRETTISGKSIIKVNGKSIVLAYLKKIREKLLDIHGQHQNQNLLNRASHINYLDSFCNEEIDPLIEKYTILKDEYISINEKISSLKGNDDREKLIDYIKFQIDDIEKGKLKIGEEEDLKEEFNLLSNAEKISMSLSKSYEILDAQMQGISVIDGLSKVVNELSTVETHFDKIREKREQIEGALYILEEASREIRDLMGEVHYDEAELEIINGRIYEISLYKKKYGESVEKILEYLNNLRVEEDELTNSEELILKLKEKSEKVLSQMKILGEKMHKIRCEKALILEEKIKSELAYVGLEKSRIKIDVVLKEIFNSRGYDEVTFLISTNPGEPLKSLEKVLSGGELSRIMLALKCVFVDKDKIPTLIFDEIDTGISGTIAKRVGEKMYQVSTKHQVLCITHLPQISALSDCHYFVSKKVENEKTFTQIKTLNKEDKVKEIAKMTSGDELTDVTLRNADEMVKLAEIKKNEIKNVYK